MSDMAKTMTPEEVKQLVERLTDHAAASKRNGYYRVSEAQTQAAYALSLLAQEREELRKLVRSAYNEGFREGMREHTSFNGGKPWDESKSRAALKDT